MRMCLVAVQVMFFLHHRHHFKQQKNGGAGRGQYIMDLNELNVSQIKFARLANKKKVCEVAAGVGLHRNQIYNLERLHAVSISAIVSYADFFGYDVVLKKR